MQITLLVLFVFSITLMLYRSLVRGDAIHTFLSKEQTDLMKGIAIVMIALAHIYQVSIEQMLAYQVRWIVLSWGSVGVSLFFFLSGYGNYFSIQKIGDNKKLLMWCLKKVWKLVLTYIVCFFSVITVFGCFLREVGILPLILRILCFYGYRELQHGISKFRY